jgi:hypothetical protein
MLSQLSDVIEFDEIDEAELIPETQFELGNASETQMVPETQLKDYPGTPTEVDLLDNSVMQRTAHVLAITMPITQSSHEPDLAHSEFMFSRPKSSGQNLGIGFVYAKAQQPVLNFSRGKLSTQPSTSSEAAAQSSDHHRSEQLPEHVLRTLLTGFYSGDTRSDQRAHATLHLHPAAPVSLPITEVETAPAPPSTSEIRVQTLSPDLNSREPAAKGMIDRKHFGPMDNIGETIPAPVGSKEGYFVEHNRNDETAQVVNNTDTEMADRTPEYVDNTWISTP